MSTQNQYRMPISRYMKRIVVCIVIMFIFTAGCIVMSVIDNNRNHLHTLQQSIHQHFAEVDEELATMNRYAISILYYNENMNLLKNADNVIDRNYHALSLLEDIEAATQFLTTKYTFCIALPQQDLVLTSAGGGVAYADKQDIVTYITSNFITADESTKAAEAWDFFCHDEKNYYVQVYNDGQNYIAMFCETNRLLSFFNHAFPGGHGEWEQITQAEVPSGSQLNIVQASIGETVKIKRLALPIRYSFLREWSFENSVTAMAPLLIIAILNISLLLHIEFTLRGNIIEPLKQFAKNLSDENAVQFYSQADNSDEITGIARFVSGLYDNIRTMKISMYEERLLRQKAEMDFLRLQIKPHFYINCLGVIFSLAESGQYELIQRLTMNLSNYMRYLFTSSHQMVSIESEIEHIAQYLDIQNVRLKTQHSVTCSSDKKTQYMVPVLSLLTLAENSSKHNRQLEQELLITITIQELQQHIRITISDNGIGYPEGILQYLNADDENSASRAVSGIGIANVKKRLKMLYGANCKLVFANSTDGGAETTLEVPKQTAQI